MASSSPKERFFLIIENTLSLQLVKYMIQPLTFYILAIIALNIFGASYAYMLITLYIVPKISHARFKTNIDISKILYISLYPLIIHLVLLTNSVESSTLNPSYYIAGTFTATIEEIYFRHILSTLGTPLTSFLYAFFHLSLNNPQNLVISTLLFPSYFFLGLLLQEIYFRDGLQYAVLFHIEYNILSLTYSMILNLNTVGLFTLVTFFSYLLYRYTPSITRRLWRRASK